MSVRGDGGTHTDRFDVEIVDVKLCVRVCGAGGVEGEGDVGRVERVVEDVGAESAVVVERFCRASIRRGVSIRVAVRSRSLPLMTSQLSAVPRFPISTHLIS